MPLHGVGVFVVVVVAVVANDLSVVGLEAGGAFDIAAVGQSPLLQRRRSWLLCAHSRRPEAELRATVMRRKRFWVPSPQETVQLDQASQPAQAQSGEADGWRCSPQGEAVEAHMIRASLRGVLDARTLSIGTNAVQEEHLVRPPVTDDGRHALRQCCGDLLEAIVGAPIARKMVIVNAQGEQARALSERHLHGE
eukprot:CAMPEP_0180480354 /NCGR_PEP_ID=MMETSP1036_2-20121128/33787_1 /TAXON_ID=632150 /ORGANISM="Azadinium spinosum, Strain 3D9" /LENGTH=193 /DNA_ID=CAMNT_0022487975 /DNA_START=114 /DNA_END=694 /DNA_ORIENTATION=-